MCVRFYIERDQPELAPFVRAAQVSPLADRFRDKLAGDILTSGEIGPASVAPAIAMNKKMSSTVYPMQWGFKVERRNPKQGAESGSISVFNARTETAKSKAAFAEAWRSHRCIVPASWYFEWEHPLDADGNKLRGDKWSIQPRGDTVAWLCGLYRIEDGLPHFVILTKEPSPDVSHIHDRMPLMLPMEDVNSWIDPKANPEKLVQHALNDMVLWK
ncbi:MAG: SOS response-associated peptidase family protein [Clostridia bacterium]|nr:SOS response-associated peptidase family protein [Clostridia bacterium]MBQ5488713.1 SOS response-associated peptidase family protein [Clostridia bacterium]